jgi:hypothetical protein
MHGGCHRLAQAAVRVACLGGGRSLEAVDDEPPAQEVIKITGG